MSETLTYEQKGMAPRGRTRAGLPFGTAVWVTGCIVLPPPGLYKPIGEYDAKTLAWRLGAHVPGGSGHRDGVLARIL